MGDVFACRNCGALLTGRYCADCGQKHEVGIPTVGHLLAEGVEGLTHADSRLWRTLRVLLTKPGFLTAEYFGGRRERYLPPIRLYLVLSFVAFLLLPVLSGTPLQVEEKAPQDAGVTPRVEKIGRAHV